MVSQWTRLRIEHQLTLILDPIIARMISCIDADVTCRPTMTDSEKSMNNETSGRCDSDILVSVVIPAFNRPNLLHRAIMSVIDQTHKNLEIFVVDDASTEDLRSLLEGFSDDRINYLRHEINKGGSAARNTGIRHSHGEYIAFLDSDDEWFPKKIETQLADFLKKAPTYHASYCRYEVFDDDLGKVVKYRGFGREGNLLSDLLFKNCIGTTSSILIRKECLDRIGGFDEMLRSGQEWEMYIRFSKYYSFAYVDSSLLRYHIHKQGRIGDSKHAETLPYIYEKHKELYMGNRKANAAMLSDVGYWEMVLGDVRKARRCFLRSLLADPLLMRNYLRILMSFRGRLVSE